MPLPLAVPLVLGGLGLASSLFGARKGAKAHRQAEGYYGRMEGDARRRYGQAQQQSAASRQQYLDQINSFDPESYFERALGGDANVATRALQGQMMQNRASLNSRGLLRSPIGNDRLMQGYQQRLADAVAQRSMEVGNMQQQKMSMYGNLYNMDQGQSNMFLQAMYGMGDARARSRAGQGDAWAQALGGMGGGMMGLGGSMMPYTRFGSMG